MTNLTAKNYRSLPPGRYRDTIGDVKGLYLKVRNERNASWQLRYVIDGRERWLGLGSAREISLSEARTRGLAARIKLIDDVDPIEVKRQAKALARKTEAQTTTFETAALGYAAHREGEWSAKQAAQFLSSMRDYAFPVFGSLAVADIDTPLVLKVLERSVPARHGKPAGKLWDTRRETASRVRSRIEGVLEWAKVRGFRSGENPARWDGHLREALPAGRRETKNHPALPYAEIAAFVATLSASSGAAVRALQFTILTAARTDEVLSAVWSEIDLVARVWTIPAERMKAGKVHRVPLSETAIALLRSLPREEGNPYLFIGSHPGEPLEIRAMGRFLKTLRSDITVHGFRSSFSDWAHETTIYPEAVVEMALAHTVKNKVKTAYHRGDLLEKRRPLMNDWAKYCTTPLAINNEVVQLRAKKR